MRLGLLVRWQGWAIIGAVGLLSRAAGQPLVQTPFPNSSSSVSEELLLDPSVEERLPARPFGIQRESMWEGPVPPEDLPPPEPPIRKRSLLTLAIDPFLLIFSGSASSVYDDNIFLSLHDREEDILYTLTPQVVAGSGDYAEQKDSFFAAGFAPSFIIFQDHDDLSGVEYDSFLEGQYSFSKLKLGSRLSYQKLSGNDQDASGRIARELYIADFVAEQALNQSTTAEVDGQFTHRDYRTRIDSDEYLSRMFLAYLLNPKVQVALGGSFGMFKPANREDQTYVEPLLRLWYQPSPKLSIRAIAGMDFRQFDERISGRQTPVADVAVVYLPSPSEHTMFSLGGYRRVQNSVSDPSQNYISNGIVFHVTQRVWHDLYLDLGTGYQHTSYYPVTRASVTQRQDDTYFVRPKIRYNFNDWGAVSMFCSWRNNDSTAIGNSWKNEQIGVEFAVGF